MDDGTVPPLAESHLPPEVAERYGVTLIRHVSWGRHGRGKKWEEGERNGLFVFLYFFFGRDKDVERRRSLAIFGMKMN